MGTMISKQRKREDRISQLPDEILTQILSLLTIKEAAQCSVLSRRWTCLWKLTTCLNFDFGEENSEICELEYVKLVNSVLMSNECPILDEFRVHYDLHRGACQDIDEWMKLVIRKRVKRLEISLSRFTGYTLPLECLKNSNIEYLTCLTLSEISIREETIDYLLSHCHQLERLYMSEVRDCFNLKVCSSSLKLKVLQIHHCELSSIEVSAPKLVTFKYFGADKEICIGNNPLLSELMVGWLHDDPMSYVLAPFSSHFSQLQMLHLRMFWEDTMEIPEFPELINLKHLTLDVHAYESRSFLDLTKFIVANPSLKKFTLQSLRYDGYGGLEKVQSRRLAMAGLQTKEKSPKPLFQPHHCLKHVEIIGFTGGHNDTVFARYLIRNAVNLETMAIDLYHPQYDIDLPPQIAKRKAAMKLEKRLPSGA